MGAIANLDELKLILKKELRQEILTEVLDIIRDEFYPPEENICKEFIKKVEAAECRVVEGKFTQYTPEDFYDYTSKENPKAVLQTIESIYKNIHKITVKHNNEKTFNA